MSGEIREMEEQIIKEGKTVGVIGTGIPKAGLAAALAKQIEEGTAGIRIADAHNEEELIEPNLPYMEVMPYVLGDGRERVYEKPEPTQEELVFDELLPESGKMEDFKFGPQYRMKDETQDHYRLRLKVERKALKIRNRSGLNICPVEPGQQWKDPNKQQAKKLAKIKKQNRIKIPRSKRQEMGLL